MQPWCRRDIHDSFCATDVFGYPSRRWPNRGQMGMEGDCFGVVAVQRRRHLDIAAWLERLQALRNGVGEQRMRSDLDERAVVGTGGGHGLAEPHRVAQG